MPYAGLTYNIDARKLHQLIHVFVQGETAETWIIPKDRKQDGRLDYLFLLIHYGGKGYKAVKVKKEEALRTSLIYKNERAMSFKKSLTNMQTIFTGFSENGDILNNLQNIRLLFQKI